MNRFDQFTQEELLELRGCFLNQSTYGYSNKLYSECDKAWNEKEVKRLAALPKCNTCGRSYNE